MNWMSKSLGRLARRSLLLGAVAGIGGAFMYLGVSWLLDLPGSPAAATIVPGMALGLGLCGLLGPVDDLYNCYWRRALKSGAFAAVMGMARRSPPSRSTSLVPVAWSTAPATRNSAPLYNA